ncbi:MAG: hypothetical protein ACRDRH_13445 [Pseudonocardia sp.]
MVCQRRTGSRADAHVTKQEVLATLMAMLLEDESFARRVRARLAAPDD